MLVKIYRTRDKRNEKPIVFNTSAVKGKKGVCKIPFGKYYFKEDPHRPPCNPTVTSGSTRIVCEKKNQC